MENQKISGLLKEGFMVTKPRACKGVIGNNLEREGLLDPVMISNEFNDIRTSVLEGNLEIRRKNEIYKENVVSSEAVDQGDDTLQLHKPDLPTKTGVPDKGINLFVQLLCSQDGNYEGRNNVNDSGEHMVRDYLLDQDFENGSAGIEGDNVGKQEHKLGVGDMVWVKTPNQLWWPGVILDPSSAAEETEKYEGMGNFLVKYFGNVNSIWCSCSNSKPFLEYFDQMSKQNHSSIFLGSIEKALSEIGRRVKAEMTCPCFLKESQKLDAQCSAKTQDVNSMSKEDKMGKSDDVLSFSQFEPSSFLARVRNLGQVGVLRDKIELTIIKNRLSAFYSSVGHCQLPMLQLRPPIGDTSQVDQDSLTRLLMDNDRNNNSEGKRNFVINGDNDSTLYKLGKGNENDDAEAVLDVKSTLSDKGLESRERKKSKYLSYPYVVDTNKGLKPVVENGTEGPKQITPSSDEKTQKKVSRKPFKGPQKIRKLGDVLTSSAHLLAELHSTALDSFYLKKGQHFDSLKRFYCSFRQFTFLDHEKLRNCPEADIFPRKAKKKNPGVKSAGVKATDDSLGTSVKINTNNSSVIGGQEKGSDGPIKRITSKKTNMAGATPELPQVDNISFGTNKTDIANNSSVIGSKETGSDVPSKEKTSKKRKKAGATPELPQINMTDGLLGLNGNNLCFSLEKVPFCGTSTSKGKLVPKRKKEGLTAPNECAVDLMDANTISFKTAPGLEDVQSNSQSNNGEGVKDGAKFTSAVSTARKSEVINMKNASLGSSAHTSLPVGPLQSDSQAEHKKRKRKANTGPVASLIPDLNGDPSEPGSLGKYTSELIASSPDGGKPEPKRRRRYKSDLSGSNVNTNNKMSKKEEDLGAILLLNFAPGFPPPSKETLIPIFSRFGLVKESETWVINDSTAQIAYDRKSDGGFACRSLEKSNPLGASLGSYKIIFPGTSQTVEEQNGVQTPHRSAPIKACKTLAKPPEAPNLIAMRRNVEMMQSVLEKKGDTLSPETRTKLENEIKGFLNKISTMVGSSHLSSKV